jgi:uncharacterized protein YcnI
MKEDQITFKNLPFLVKHFGGINAVYEFKNGWKISVSAGEFPYSYPRENFGNPEGYSSFEVAVIDNNDDFATKRITDSTDDVLGWMSRDEINELIQVVETM